MTVKKKIQFDSIEPKNIAGFVDLFDGQDLREFILVPVSKGWVIEFADTGKKENFDSLDDAVKYLHSVEREDY